MREAPTKAASGDDRAAGEQGEGAMSEAATDRGRLRGAAYATPGPLAARAALYQYEDDRLDLPGRVLDLAEQERPLSAGSRLLDVGCGPGAYLAAAKARHPGITAIGFDLSAGMAGAAHGTNSPTAVADAMQIPARTDAFDVVICAHMLYHAPDIAVAAAELARVVRPDGIVAIATNGARHLLELDTLRSDAVRTLSDVEWNAPAHSHSRFLFEDAAELIAPALDVVRADASSRTITVPDAAPLVAYVDSGRSLFEPSLPAGITWEQLITAFEAHAAAVIARDGPFVIHSEGGVLLCRAA